MNNHPKGLVRLIKAFPLATVITTQGEEIMVTETPLIYRPSRKCHGLLRGHIDRYNPQVATLEDQPVKVVFHGPDCYISPNVYTTQQLPTWNYVKIHATGIVRLRNEPEFVKRLLLMLTDQLESGPLPFKMEEDDPRLNKLLPYVVGFEIEVNEWQGRIKLSQDKIRTDQENAMEELIRARRQDHSDLLWSLLPDPTVTE